MSQPIRIHVRARAKGELPDITQELRDQICGVIRVHDFSDGTSLWNLTFAWPTFDHLQVMIAGAVAKLEKNTTWTTREALPKTSIDVKEQVADLAKPPVDGMQPTKVVTVSRTIKEVAARYGFVGEARAVAVEKPVEKELSEAIEK